MTELPAPAKVNLHLRITGITPEGYHELDTSFAYTDACDLLYVEPSTQLEVSCSNSRLNGADNLVYRVLETLRRRYRINEGLRVHVDKHIPMQAGLGGGSSDAATALIAANHLWRLELGSRELIEFAAPFGADIPCFLFGRASRATGIGDQLTTLDVPSVLSGAPPHVVLAHPGIGLSTADVFRRFDAQHAGGKLSISKDVTQLTPSETTATIRAGLTDDATSGNRDAFPLGENALEPVSCTMSCKLADLLAGMRRTQSRSWMSGSGSACVSLCGDADSANMLAGHLLHTGLATWSHASMLRQNHPLQGSSIQPNDWGVAKR